MSSTIPHKIVLKSTTKISLNERFSNIQATRVQNAPPVQQVRAQMAATQQASAKNRRLAQQMANRPTVQAALRLKKKSLAQRLGSNVRSRLSLQGNVVQGRGRGMRSRGRGRGRGMVRASSQMSLKSSTSSVDTGSVTSYRGGGGMRGQRSRGTRIFRGTMRGRGRGVRGVPQGIRGRGGRGARRGVRGAVRGVRGMVRGARGARRGGRGRGGGPQLSREQLDNQLDEYMTKTKGYLDSELDQYMAGGE